jgi:hypothetical protein
MNNTDLPPLPAIATSDPEICNLVQRYLAIETDLSDEQRRLLSYHLQHCSTCVREWQILNNVTRAITSLEGSQPSARVDQAVMAAIAASTRTTQRRRFLLPRRQYITIIAACLSMLLIATLLIITNLQTTFRLPANLSWNSSVLYYTRTMIASNGKEYHIQTYHNLATNQMNVETVMGNQVHVETISNAHQTLGIDMMHRVAQWDANAWSSDDSLFNLDGLRHDLQTGKAVYLGKGHFKGQEVYQVRTPERQILLLDMDYMPVNVLETENQTNQKPMYEEISWLAPEKVPGTMWQMDVPQGYRMGQLPSHPRFQ